MHIQSAEEFYCMMEIQCKMMMQMTSAEIDSFVHVCCALFLLLRINRLFLNLFNSDYKYFIVELLIVLIFSD